jgi:hypothetical protein
MANFTNQHNILKATGQTMWFSLLGPLMNHNICEWPLFETTDSTNDGFFIGSAVGMTISTKTGRIFEYWSIGDLDKSSESRLQSQYLQVRKKYQHTIEAKVRWIHLS